MYVFGGNDVNRTFSDLWRISLRDIVSCADRQWEMERTPKSGKQKENMKQDSSMCGAPQQEAGFSPVPYKHPRWKCLCRDSSLAGE